MRAIRQSPVWRSLALRSLADNFEDAQTLEDALLSLSDEAFIKAVQPKRGADGALITGDPVADEWERQYLAEELARESITP